MFVLKIILCAKFKFTWTSSILSGNPIPNSETVFFFFLKREREKERRNHRAVNVFGDGLIFRKNTVSHQIALQNISERSR